MQQLVQEIAYRAQRLLNAYAEIDRLQRERAAPPAASLRETQGDLDLPDDRRVIPTANPASA